MIPSIESSRELGRELAKARFAGKPKGKKGRLFPNGGAAMAAATAGARNAAEFEAAARKTWKDLLAKKEKR